MKLMLNEEVVSKTNDLTLTNFRIRYSLKGGGEAEFVSILLENIQSISMKYKSRPILIILAALIALFSVISSMDNGEGMLVVGLITAGILVGIYFATRKHYLTISSAGDAINILIKGQNTQNLIDYIDLVENTTFLRKAALNNIANQHHYND